MLISSSLGNVNGVHPVVHEPVSFLSENVPTCLPNVVRHLTIS